ncbi:hypothetical protein SLEP1_g19131 [Rubroshorea leprosula]|nr:hypothetical protein SLEP1_g19131 [Rubroshorea leprosula]
MDIINEFPSFEGEKLINFAQQNFSCHLVDDKIHSSFLSNILTFLSIFRRCQGSEKSSVNDLLFELH